MDLLYILLITGVVICLLLALCICCFANSRYCHCVDFVYDDEDSEPIKTKTGTSSRELSRSEYYSNSTPILGSSKTIQHSDFATNGHQYSPLFSQRSSSKQLDDETPKTTFYASPGPNSTVSETSYSTRKNFYPPEPAKYEASYSTTKHVYPSEPSGHKTGYTTEISYSSERSTPYQVTTRTSNVTQQPHSPYSEDTFYRTQTPQYDLKKSPSQTSLYENN